MTPLPWFRVYANDLLTDRKIKRICKRIGQSKALIVGVWITLLCLANDSPNRGHLNIAADMPYTVEDLEDETGLPAEVLAQIFDEFRAHGMIDGKSTIQISNWDKRQYKSDNVTERVQRYRAQRYNETLQQRSNNVIDTDTDTDTEADKNLPSTSYIRLFCDVTTMMAIPGREEDRAYAIDALLQMESQYNNKAAEYLKPYYQEWIGRGYSKTNIHWLDWAIAGEIPPRKSKKEKSIDEQLADAGYR